MSDLIVSGDKLQRYHNGIKGKLTQPVYAISENPLTFSLTADGEAITPMTNKPYMVLNGTYINRLFRWDGSQYVMVGGSGDGSGNGFVPAYIVGNTPFAIDWLSDEAGGTAITPEDDLLYLIMTDGDYKNSLYRYDSTSTLYEAVSSPTGSTPVMIGATELLDGSSGSVPKPRAGDQNKVLLGRGAWGTIPTMIGATSSAAGAAGSAPKPEVTDRSKALFGDGQYHTIYSSAAGSTVMVLTQEAELLGKTVYMTDGRTTLSATMGQDGEAIFTDVQLAGGVTLTCEDSQGNVARASANLTYFGTYNVAITLNFATIHVTTSDGDLLGQTIELFLNGSKVGESAFNNQGIANIYVDTLGTYTLKAVGGDRHAFKTVAVTALKQTFNVEMFLFYCYGFQIDENNADPTTCVTPYESDYGCDNLGFTPAHMDFTNNVFNYGTWTGDEFFFPKPCMLKSNGVVDYYLDKNNYAKRSDGVTDSDYNNRSYDGNVMLEFPTVYFSRRQAGGKTFCVISDKKLDATFHAYAHHDKNGNVLPYIYLAAYNGAYISGKARSISGVAYHNRNALTDGYIMSNTTRQQEMNYAKANNSRTDCEGWNVLHKADWDMVNDLLILISMRTDTDVAFGRGRDSGYVSPSNTGIITTGSMDNKGLFWGENQGAAGVKVFGIENWWGNMWRNCIGWINNRGTQLVKLTYGQEDGSTVDDYNLTGSGFISVAEATPQGTNGGYINKWKYSEKGLNPYTASGSATTYLCDGFWFDNSQVDCAFVGGGSADGLLCGAFCSYLNYTASNALWNIGCSLSYKDAV